MELAVRFLVSAIIRIESITTTVTRVFFFLNDTPRARYLQKNLIFLKKPS